MREKKLRTVDLCYIALFSVLLAVCAQISIPGPVPFTLQTFAVFMALVTLGGRRGSLAILVYLLMGAVGLPVFAGFRGGLGVLFGATGGYIWGFLLSGLLYWAITAHWGQGQFTKLLASLLGLLLCYTTGTAWFMLIYSRSGSITLGGALAACVLPFLLPDLIKLGLAVLLSQRLSPHLGKAA